jgi:alpha-L-rhamnosidase
VTGFLFRRIAGIELLSPGFASFFFDPVYDPRMAIGGGTYHSRSGAISTQWEWLGTDRFKLDLIVPPNVEAMVVLPAREMAQLGKTMAHLAECRVTKGFPRLDCERRLVLQLGSGHYELDVASAQLDQRPAHQVIEKRGLRALLRDALLRSKVLAP